MRTKHTLLISTVFIIGDDTKDIADSSEDESSSLNLDEGLTLVSDLRLRFVVKSFLLHDGCEFTSVLGLLLTPFVGIVVLKPFSLFRHLTSLPLRSISLGCDDRRGRMGGGRTSKGETLADGKTLIGEVGLRYYPLGKDTTSSEVEGLQVAGDASF